jgi:hypothetical protein
MNSMREDLSAIAREAYIRGFSPVQTRLALKLMKQRGLELNQFYCATRLATPADKGAAGPSVDLLYFVAWLDLSGEPQVISVPDTHDRYYTIQLIDAFGDSFHYIGRRTTGTRPGHFAVAEPNWCGDVPDGVTLINAATNTVAAVGRIFVADLQDLPAVLAAQRGYAISPLSQYPTIRRFALPLENPASIIPVFHPHELGIGFFDELGAALSDYPIADEAFIGRLESIGVGSGKTPSQTKDKALHDRMIAACADADVEIRNQFLKRTSDNNGWGVRYGVTERVGDHLERASLNYYGIGHHIAKEAIYFMGRQGPDGHELTGDKRYVLTFPAGGLPPVDAFWSLTLYGPDWLLQDNPIDRYAIGDRTKGLELEGDGSLRILIQHEQPASGSTNWLPAPRGTFHMVLRCYQPRPSLFNGQFHMPRLAFA